MYVLEEFHLPRWPLIKIYRFNFGNMHSELSVDATTSNTNKDAKVDGGPTGDLAGAVRAILIVVCSQEFFAKSRLLVNVNHIFESISRIDFKL